MDEPDPTEQAVQDMIQATEAYLARRDSRAHEVGGGPLWEGDPVDWWWERAAFEAAWTRDDGHPLGYADAVNTIYGRPGTGKTWLGLMWLLQHLEGESMRALWWNFDSAHSDLGERVRMLGGQARLQAAAAADAFRYQAYEPDAHVKQLAAWLDGGLLVIDTVESAGCPSDGADISPWWSNHVGPFQAANCTVLLLDHTPKNAPEDGGRVTGGIGSQAKLARISGTALHLDGQCWSRDGRGAVTATVDKDRLGAVGGTGSAVATVSGWYDRSGGFRWSIGEPPTEEDIEARKHAEADERVLGAIAAAGEIRGQNTVRDASGIRKQDAVASLARLVAAGKITEERSGNSWVWRVV